jgi:trigger factor
MTDETNPSSESPGAATLDAAAADASGGENKTEKLNQSVDIQDTGPCKKHIKVTIFREDIDKLLDAKFTELVREANVPGFRPGKAPRQVIRRRFHKEVTDQVRGQILLASLEQLAEDHDVAPLSPPNLDPTRLEIPREGPFIYEFDVEVRPQFDLPNYKGLKLKRPIKTFTPDDVEREERRFLSRYGQLVPKEAGDVQIEDYITADITTKLDGHVLGTMKEATLRVDAQVAFKDCVASQFGTQVAGAKAGEVREVDIQLSDAVANPALRGIAAKAFVEIKDVKQIRLPELTEDFLRQFGVTTPAQMREMVGMALDRRLEYEQRQAARDQVLQAIAASQTWELPRDLLMRQAKKHLARKVMEMQEAGMTDEELRGRQMLLQQNVLRSTALALKEHFVLQKIAEVEKIDVTEDEINEEIERVADQERESPRRVRARLEKDELLETLAAQIIERKALNLILERAEYEDVALDSAGSAGSVSTVDAQAVPGELQDPTAAPPAEPPPAS